MRSCTGSSCWKKSSRQAKAEGHNGDPRTRRKDTKGTKDTKETQGHKGYKGYKGDEGEHDTANRIGRHHARRHPDGIMSVTPRTGMPSISASKWPAPFQMPSLTLTPASSAMELRSCFSVQRLLAARSPEGHKGDKGHQGDTRTLRVRALLRRNVVRYSRHSASRCAISIRFAARASATTTSSTQLLERR
jgi:hypothetical protein